MLHKSQVFALVLGVVIVGITVASFWFVSVSVLHILLIIVVALAFLGRRHRGFLVGSMALLALVAGAHRFQAEAAKVSQFEGLGNTVQVVGYVEGDFTVSSSGRGQFPLRVFSLNSQTLTTPEKILVYAPPVPIYRYGEVLKVEGKLFKPEPFDGFDYPSYLRVSGIFMTLQSFLITETEITTYNCSKCYSYKYRFFGKTWRIIFDIRDRFAQAIDLSVAEPAAGYVKGILLGLRINISPELKDAFARTGTSHVLAISGYNITIIAKYLLGALVYFMRRQKALWVVMGALAVFVIMTGASASVVRAAIMGSIVLIASGIGRLSDAKQLLILAAAVMALINPYIVRFDTGFQLSFAAVAGLIFIQPLLEPHVRRITRTDFLTDLVSATLAAQIAVAPLLAFYFGTVSVVLLVANLLVLPFIPVTMLLGFATGVVGIVWILPAQVLGWTAWALAQWQISVVEFLGNLPWASFEIEFSNTMVVLSYLCMSVVVWYLLKRKREVESLSF